MSGAPKLKLLAASPPDIIRGAQKDELYSSQVLEACHDMAQRVLGVFPALQYEREIKVLAQLLYHGLTTGTGLQTLGEEYCNMLQVTGSGHMPGRTRRTTLALLQSLGPYLAEKAMAQLEAENRARSSNDFSHEFFLEEGVQPPNTHEGSDYGDGEARVDNPPHCSSHGVNARGSVQHSDHSSSATTRGGVQHSERNSVITRGVVQHSERSSDTTRESVQHRKPMEPSSSATSTSVGRVGVASISLSALRTKVRLLLRTLQGRRWLNTRWGAALAAAVRPLTTFGARLHLALFYMWGVYYQLPLRLLGIRFVSTARPLQQRTSYWTLGAVLASHLALTAALHVRRAALEASGQLLAGGSGDKVAGVVPHARLVDDRDEESGLGTSTTGAYPHAQQPLGIGERSISSAPSVRVQPRVPPSSRQCPLCLAPRNHATSTPCGHVFCWSCVAQWCGEKPECPVCRTRTVQSQLVPLYHSSLF